MKNQTIFFFLLLISTFLVGCTQSKTTKSSSSTTANCSLYPYTYGCPGNPYTGTTTGTTTGGGTGAVNCSPPAQGTQAQCGNYCQYYPQTTGCVSFNGSYVNCNYTPSASGCPGSSTLNASNYGDLYQYGVPAGGLGCGAAVAPSNNPNAFDTRKGTITVAGQKDYNPENGAGAYLNSSSFLTSINSANTFFMTDASVKLRIKARQQPDSRLNSGACFGRVSGQSQAVAGYTKLRFIVHVKDGSSTSAPWEFVNNFEVGVNNCSTPIDLSPYKAQYPNGLYVKVSSVQTNQFCSYSQAQLQANGGYTNCTVFSLSRSGDCWSMDFEVSADSTKVFP